MDGELEDILVALGGAVEIFEAPSASSSFVSEIVEPAAAVSAELPDFRRNPKF